MNNAYFISMKLSGKGFFIGLLICFSYGSAQEVIKEIELEDFYRENKLYPYTITAPTGISIFKQHDPSLRISEAEFVHVIKPDNHKSELRALVKYNLLLEEVWKTEFELGDEETILHIFQSDGFIRVLTEEYRRQDKEHLVLVRSFDLAEGEERQIKIIQKVEGKWENTPIPVFSPNDSLLLVYHYWNNDNFRSPRFLFEYENTDDTPGFRALRATQINLKVFDLSLNEQMRDTIMLAKSSKNKSSDFGCYLDNLGNIYHFSVSRNQQLKVRQIRADGSAERELNYDNFPKFWLEDEEDFTHFPPLISQGERVFIAIGQSKRNRGFGGRRVDNLQIICFDFKEEEVDLRRNVKVNSSIVVNVSKAREEAGLRPITKFNNYAIRELKELPDGGMLLIAQKYNQFDNNRYSYTLFDLSNSDFHLPTPNITLEEIVIFQFDPMGKLFRTITIPSTQRIKVLTELTGHFYSSHLDWENFTLHFLMHENDGAKYSDPMRLFHRSVNLETGKVEERTQLFDHKRRNHYFSREHTVWLNEKVVTFMMHVNTGITTRTYLLSYNLDS